MKLLLTSAGLSNKTICKALERLVGKPAGKTKIAFIPTAANWEDGDKEWLINDYINLKKEGYLVDIVDISAIEKEKWLPRLEWGDVIFFGGGNTSHLMYWVEKSELKGELPRLLKTRVYAGISAGSCMTGPTIYNSVQNLFDEGYKFKIEKGLGLVDLQLIPHLDSDYFPKIRPEFLEQAAKDIKEPVYAIDDNTAVIVDGKNIKVVSEGKWVKFN